MLQCLYLSTVSTIVCHLLIEGVLLLPILDENVTSLSLAYSLVQCCGCGVSHCVFTSQWRQHTENLVFVVFFAGLCLGLLPPVCHTLFLLVTKYIYVSLTVLIGVSR